jgi:hypothetical protein
MNAPLKPRFDNVVLTFTEGQLAFGTLRPSSNKERIARAEEQTHTNVLHQLEQATRSGHHKHAFVPFLLSIETTDDTGGNYKVYDICRYFTIGTDHELEEFPRGEILAALGTIVLTPERKAVLIQEYLAEKLAWELFWLSRRSVEENLKLYHVL